VKKFRSTTECIKVSVEEKSSFIECVKTSCWYKEEDFSYESSAMETRVGDSLKSVEDPKEFCYNVDDMEEAEENNHRRENIGTHEPMNQKESCNGLMRWNKKNL